MDWIDYFIGVDNERLGDGTMSVNWYHMPELWVLVLVLIPSVIAFTVYFYRRERRDIHSLIKPLLITLRCVLFLSILFILFKPVMTAEKIFRKRSHVIVLVDESMSMKFSDNVTDAAQLLKMAKVVGMTKGETLTPAEEDAMRSMTRMEIVNKVLTNSEINITEKLDEKLIVNYFTFSNKVRSGTERGKLEPKGHLTAIGDAILGAMNMMRDKYVAAIVIFSDGKNNHGRDPVDVARMLKMKSLPIYTVAPGVPQVPRDLRLLEIEAKDVVRVKDVVRIDFKVLGTGYEGKDIACTLTQVERSDRSTKLTMDPEDIQARIASGRMVGGAHGVIEKDGEKQSMQLTYKPDAPGEYEIIVSIEPKEDEATVANNYLSYLIRVVDNNIKILYVDYPPRYEYRFLKNALIRDDSIKVQCLLLSADYDFPQESSPDMEPLKEFPATKAELMKYDVIIFGDINPMDLASGGQSAEETMRHIEAFVSEFGGGVIFISGTKDNPRSFAGTRLAHMLPIVPEDDGLMEAEKIYAQEVGYAVTEEGKHHPILKLEEESTIQENVELWEDADDSGDRLRGLYWYVKVKKVKPTATILVETKDTGGEGQDPLFMTMPYGAGRTFFSATDETWRWRFVVGDRYFYTFWRQAIEWVMYGKLRGSQRYRITLSKERYAIGEHAAITVKAYDQNFEPLDEEELKVHVDPPEGEQVEVTLKKLKRKDGKQGFYRGSYSPRETGYYNVWLGDDDEKSRAYGHFSVYMPNRETTDPILDIESLKKIAASSGDPSHFFEISDIERLPEKVRSAPRNLSEIHEDDMWDSPLVYLLFTLFISIEWVVRKMNRMI